MEKSPRLKKLRSCEAASTFQSQSTHFASLENNYSSTPTTITRTRNDKQSICTTCDCDCDIEDHLHGLEYIDRTPSPTEQLT